MDLLICINLVPKPFTFLIWWHLFIIIWFTLKKSFLNIVNSIHVSGILSFKMTTKLINIFVELSFLITISAPLYSSVWSMNKQDIFTWLDCELQGLTGDFRHSVQCQVRLQIMMIRVWGTTEDEESGEELNNNILIFKKIRNVHLVLRWTDNWFTLCHKLFYQFKA